jgi:hypothetical protein
MKGGRKEKRNSKNRGVQELEVEIYEIQKRGAKKAGVQYNGVQKRSQSTQSGNGHLSDEHSTMIIKYAQPG